MEVYSRPAKPSEGVAVIHYHGTPMSGPVQDAARFLSGRHCLIPHMYPSHLGTALDVCQSIVLDNSAFSHWKKGGDVDLYAYRDWVHSLAGHPALDWCLIPDKIDGDEGHNIALVNQWLRLGCDVQSVPVWHMHESLSWLGWLADHFLTVAMGSSGQWATPGTSGWWQRMGAAMGAVCDDRGRPRCRLHGLRMLDPRIFTRLPLASADSTNAAVNSGAVSRYGMYPHPNAAGRAAVIADRIESNSSAEAWQFMPHQPDLLMEPELKQ